MDLSNRFWWLSIPLMQHTLYPYTGHNSQALGLNMLWYDSAALARTLESWLSQLPSQGLSNKGVETLNTLGAAELMPICRGPYARWVSALKRFCNDHEMRASAIWSVRWKDLKADVICNHHESCVLVLCAYQTDVSCWLSKPWCVLHRCSLLSIWGSCWGTLWASSRPILSFSFIFYQHLLPASHDSSLSCASSSCWKITKEASRLCSVLYCNQSLTAACDR